MVNDQPNTVTVTTTKTTNTIPQPPRPTSPDRTMDLYPRRSDEDEFWKPNRYVGEPGKVHQGLITDNTRKYEKSSDLKCLSEGVSDMPESYALFKMKNKPMFGGYLTREGKRNFIFKNHKVWTAGDLKEAIADINQTQTRSSLAKHNAIKNGLGKDLAEVLYDDNKKGDKRSTC